jgi:hypothetical protein
MKRIHLLALLTLAGGCTPSSSGPEAFVKPGEVVLTPPPGTVIAPQTVADDPKAPVQLPADSAFTEVTPEELASVLPAIPRARVLSAPANPGGARFFVGATYCLDGETATGAAASAREALRSARWESVQAAPPPTEEGRAELNARRGPYVVSGYAVAGDRRDCDSARGSVLIDIAIRKQR